MKVRDIDHGWKRIKEQAREINDSRVRIGILQNAGMAKTRNEKGKLVKSDATLAEVAFWNEYGTDDIPERPFVRATADENRNFYAKILKVQLGEVFARRKTVQGALELVGTKAKAQLKKKIRDVKSPPNAPYTIQKKGSSNPLINTGSMLRAVDFEVKQ